MASMVNQDLLNARDLAIQGGHLELAKLLRANSDQPQPRDYEFPVLKPFTPPTSPMSEASSYYDVPRPVEQFYVVPPPPRPVDAKETTVTKMKKDTSTSYVPMLPKSNQSSGLRGRQTSMEPLEANTDVSLAASKMEDDSSAAALDYDRCDVSRHGKRALSFSKECEEIMNTTSDSKSATTSATASSSSSRPQSRQELLSNLRKTLSLEDLHDASFANLNLNNASDAPIRKNSICSLEAVTRTPQKEDFQRKTGLEIAEFEAKKHDSEPKSPLSIVTPFPFVTLESPSKSKMRPFLQEAATDLNDTKGELFF